MGRLNRWLLDRLRYGSAPPELRWMDGRAVFFRPEGRASNAARRDIIHTEEEAVGLSRAVRELCAEARAKTPADIEAEIAEFAAWQRQQDPS